MKPLTEPELREHYTTYELDYVANIPHLTRLQLEVGTWYPYNAIKHFNDVVPCKNTDEDKLAHKLGLPEYPPLVFCYNGGNKPWTQAIDNHIMYVDRDKYMCYHEEEYAKHGLDWLRGADEQLGEILCTIRNIYSVISVEDYTAIDYVKEIENDINYRRMCYDAAINLLLEEMEYQQECHEASKHFEDYMNVPFPEVYEKAMDFKRPVLHCDKDGNTWINSQE